MVMFAGGCIDSTEVTNTQYMEFLAANPLVDDQEAPCAWNVDFDPDPSWRPEGRMQEPVAFIDWCDAAAFCAWAGKRLCGSPSGGPTNYDQFDDAGASLWQEACTGGTQNEYPYGNVYVADLCNSSDSGANAVRSVAELSSCEGGVLGLFHMSGNVAEWEDSCGASGGELDSCRARGGSFLDGREDVRCQSSIEPNRRDRVANVGFRCCSSSP